MLELILVNWGRVQRHDAIQLTVELFAKEQGHAIFCSKRMNDAF
jgi:hypothetical protein